MDAGRLLRRHGLGDASASGGSLCPDVADNVLLAFHQVHHGAGNGLFAFECRDPWAFAEIRAALIDLGHLRRFDGLVAPS